MELFKELGGAAWADELGRVSSGGEGDHPVALVAPVEMERGSGMAR